MATGLQKIKGHAQMSAMLKKLRGGPQSMLPLAPGKGTGVKSLKGNTPKRKRGFVTAMQNPALTPKTGGFVKTKRKI